MNFFPHNSKLIGRILQIKALLIVIALKLTLVQSVQTVSSLNKVSLTWASVIYGFAYGRNKENLYYSGIDFSGIKYIRRYNATQLALNGSIAPLTVYLPNQQTVSYNKIIEVNQSHIAVYTDTSPIYEIFNINGSSYYLNDYTASNQQITFIQYSFSRQEVYLLYLTGQFDILQLNNFLNIPGGLRIRLAIYQSYSRSMLSPDESFIAIYTVYINGVLRVIDLAGRTQLFSNYSKSYLCAIAWHTDSQSIYVHDGLAKTVDQKYMTFPFNVINTYSLPTFPSMNINATISMSYLSLKKQLLWIGQANGTIQLMFVSYYINITSGLKIYMKYIPKAISQICVHFAKNSSSQMMFNIRITGANNYTYIGDISLIAQIVTNNTNTTNTTNTNNATNATTTNITANITINSNNTITIMYGDIKITYMLQFLLGLTQNEGILMLNKFPGSRKYLKPIFKYFVNFDDLQLYAYHDKQYNQAIDSLFQNIRQLEEQKWKALNYQTLWRDKIGINTDALQDYLNSTNKVNFTNSKFLQQFQNSNGYFLNTLNFYLSNLYLIIIIFFIGKLIYSGLEYFDFKLKYLMRQFKFGMFLLLMLFEGNIQYMAYLFGFQTKTLFQSSWQEKLIEIIVLLINFLFFFVLTSLYLWILHNYKKQSLEIYENQSNQWNGCLYLTIQQSIRNISLGFIHIILQQNRYQLKISVLIWLQIIFLSIKVSFIKNNSKKGFSKKINVWINIVTTFVRILLISTFLLNFNQNEQFQYSLQIKISCIIIINYLFLWIVSVIVGFGYKFNEIFQLVLLKTCKNKLNSFYKGDKLQKNKLQSLQPVNRRRLSQPHIKNKISSKRFPIINTNVKRLMPTKSHFNQPQNPLTQDDKPVKKKDLKHNFIRIIKNHNTNVRFKPHQQVLKFVNKDDLYLIKQTKKQYRINQM